MDKISLLFKIADQETKSGNYQKAIDSYEEIIDLSKGNIKTQHIANWGIGEIYLNNNQYENAKFYLKKAVKLDPNESNYHYLLGCTYTYTKEIDKAIVHLEKAVELDGSIDIFWNQLGWVVGYNRDVNQGIEYLKKSLQLNQNNYSSLKDLCMLYAKNEKWDVAIICIEEAISKNPHVEEFAEIKKNIAFFKSEFERLAKKK